MNIHLMYGYDHTQHGATSTAGVFHKDINTFFYSFPFLMWNKCIWGQESSAFLIAPKALRGVLDSRKYLEHTKSLLAILTFSI